MSETIVYTGTLVVVNCGCCGTRHAIPEQLQRQAKEYGKKWYCPTGCHITYCDNDLKRIKEELEQANSSIASRDDRINRLHNELTNEKHKVRAEKSAKTRLKNRVKHGVCPCCNRTFKQLADHMKEKHPEYITN